MFEKALIFGLYSVTPVHAGSGAELSVIDLPIQRERHTGFPVIWGQSLKGVLRSCFRKLELNEDNGSKWINLAWIYITGKSKDEYKDKEEKKKADKSIKTYIEKVKQGRRDPPLTEIIFGPSTEAASEHSGAISVGDAKILLFPVRSLKGVFAYVTCPLVLERFVNDVEFVSKINKNKCGEIFKNIKGFINELTNNNDRDDQKAVVFSNDLVIERNNKKYIVLEDFLLEVSNIGAHNCNNELVNLFKELLPNGIGARVSKKLAIVSDDVFTAFVTTTTEIVARVKIDAKTGTVQTGALWYEEYLPSDTLLYSVITIGKPKTWGKDESERRRNEQKIMRILGCNGVKNEKCFVEKVTEKLRGLEEYLQIGGDETVGKGFVKVKVWGDK